MLILTFSVLETLPQTKSLMTSGDLCNFLGPLLWYNHLIPLICSHIKFAEMTKNLYTVSEMTCIGELLEINF